MDRQTEIINKFRSQIAHLLKDNYEASDIYLSKWLSPCKFDVETAEKNMENALEWRKLNGIDDISKENMPEVYKGFNLTIDGFDRFGRPLIYIRVAGWELKNFVKQKNGTDNFVKYLAARFAESSRAVKKQFDKTGGQVHQFVYLVDFKNASMRNMCSAASISAAIKACQMYDYVFPGSCNAYYVFNAPKFATILFTAIRPFLNKETNDALKIYDSNKKVWEAELLKILEPSQLPTSDENKLIEYEDEAQDSS